MKRLWRSESRVRFLVEVARRTWPPPVTPVSHPSATFHQSSVLTLNTTPPTSATDGVLWVTANLIQQQQHWASVTVADLLTLGQQPGDISCYETEACCTTTARLSSLLRLQCSDAIMTRQYRNLGFMISHRLHEVIRRGRVSLVGIATPYGLDGPEIESRRRRFFVHPSRTALRPTQPPIQCVPGLSRE